MNPLLFYNETKPRKKKNWIALNVKKHCYLTNKLIGKIKSYTSWYQHLYIETNTKCFISERTLIGPHVALMSVANMRLSIENKIKKFCFIDKKKADLN